MTYGDRADHIEAIDAEISCLAESRDRGDRIAAYRHLGNVLEWLHRLEEFDKNAAGNAAYFAHRESSVNGRTLGGLIYVRGFVHHGNLDVKDIAFREAPVKVRVDGAWVEKPIRVRQGDEWLSARVSVARLVWPPLSALPQPPTPEKHHRDVHYENLVAGRPLSDPIRSARGYLVVER